MIHLNVTLYLHKSPKVALNRLKSNNILTKFS